MRVAGSIGLWRRQCRAVAVMPGPCPRRSLPHPPHAHPIRSRLRRVRRAGPSRSAVPRPAHGANCCAKNTRTGLPDRRPIAPADDEALLRAHTPAHLARLRGAPAGGMFDPDTAVLPGIDDHARRAAGAAMAASPSARWKGDKAFSLMRPPGHHATRGPDHGVLLPELGGRRGAARAGGARGGARGGVGFRRPPRQRHGGHSARTRGDALRQRAPVPRLSGHGHGARSTTCATTPSRPARRRRNIWRPWKKAGRTCWRSGRT